MRPFARATLPLLILLAATRASAQPSTVILVRHAEKASQTDADPILSDLGIQRAKDLDAALGSARVDAVITTQYQRTKLTAAPLVASLHLTPVVVANASATHVADVAAAVKRQPPGSVVLVVGHSNTIPAIIAALGGPTMPNICDSRYATMFILEMNGTNPPRLIRARYGAADPDDASCKD